MDRITAIQTSLTAFVCGMFGIVPFFGLPPGIYALMCWGKIRRHYRTDWNPARNYLRWGAILALLGISASFLIVGVVLVTYL